MPSSCGNGICRKELPLKIANISVYNVGDAVSVPCPLFLQNDEENLVLQQVKYAKKNQEKVSVESAMYLTDENALSISVEEEALVWDWIDALPTERRNIFLMAKQQGMKYKEIAVQLDISVKTVEGQMGKALKALRDKAIKIYLFFFG